MKEQQVEDRTMRSLNSWLSFGYCNVIIGLEPLCLEELS